MKTFIERIKHIGILTFQITFGIILVILALYVIIGSFFSSDEQFEGAISQSEELYKEVDIDKKFH